MGCDKSNVNELENELKKFNYTIEYINLHGQFSNIDVNIENEEDFEKMDRNSDTKKFYSYCIFTRCRFIG
ncbi:MAG: hypothetical protein E7J43_05240 [Finegoldia magna]|uniref:hypothetical protein n=1 Tax=Finegoldia magna TaxID=1260 RepID=UPI00291387E4|nr:hypothetical protein [Finegoldia magna]MDU7890120.1 hypothetical protein [Finegoldia magna]MDU7926289.1 hypothetical protein [Finegoldia magna]